MRGGKKFFFAKTKEIEKRKSYKILSKKIFFFFLFFFLTSIYTFQKIKFSSKPFLVILKGIQKKKI